MVGTTADSFPSRAKQGMYIVGNSETYTHIPMWSKVIKLLKDAGNMGPSLPLCCPQHPDTSIDVSTPEDFLRKAPEGGCALQCGLELHCGHICTYKCHSEARHQSVTCREPCERLHGDCGHLCTRYVHFEHYLPYLYAVSSARHDLPRQVFLPGNFLIAQDLARSNYANRGIFG